MLMSLVAVGWALDAHGFSFHGVTGDVEEYTRLGYPSAGLFGDADVSVLMDYARDPLTENTPEGRVPVLAALGTATVAGAFSFGGAEAGGGAAYPPHRAGSQRKFFGTGRRTVGGAGAAPMAGSEGTAGGGTYSRGVSDGLRRTFCVCGKLPL